MTRKVVPAVLLALLAAACGSGPPPAPAGATPAGQGDWTGTLTRRVDLSESMDGATTTETYLATVAFHSTSVDIRRWTLSGDAAIKATGSIDMKSSETTPLGQCTLHYTDDMLAEGRLPVDGGLEQRGTQVEFSIQLPGLSGSLIAVRDESGCFGTRTESTEPWSVGAISVGGSGELSGNSVSGSTTLDAETVTWALTYQP